MIICEENEAVICRSASEKVCLETEWFKFLNLCKGG